MREALKRVTVITAYTTAYYTIGAVAWLCGHSRIDGCTCGDPQCTCRDEKYR